MRPREIHARVRTLVAGTCCVMAAPAWAAIPVAVDDDASMISGLAPNITAEVLSNDDAGDAPVTVRIVEPPDDGTAFVLTDPINYNKITFVPNADFNGTDSLVYRVTDADGDTDSATLTLQVFARGACSADTADADHDTPVTVDVLENDADFAAPVARVEIWTQPSQGTAVVNPDHTITYTPETGFGGQVNFAYAVYDDTSEPPSGAICNVRVTVDDLVVIHDDTIWTLPDAARVLGVTVNDEGLVNPYRIQITASPAHGTAAEDPDDDEPGFKDIRYTPDTGFIGSDSLTYQLTDEDGDTGTATVDITVAEQGSCTNDTVATERNAPVVIDVLTNDADFDTATVTVGIGQPPGQGTAAVNADNTITYTPEPDVGGPAFFSYLALRPAPKGAYCAVRVDVDDYPIVEDDVMTAQIDSPADFDVTFNDTPGADRPYRIAFPVRPAHGTVEVVTVPIQGDPERKVIRYTPDAGYSGADNLRYRLIDDDGDGDKASVDITVSSNATPAATEDFTRNALGIPVGYPVGANASGTFDVLANDTGLGNSPLTSEIVVTPLNGEAVMDAEGRITYTPDRGYVGDRVSVSEDPEACTDGLLAVCVIDLIPGLAVACPAADDPDCYLPAGDRVLYRVTDSDDESSEAVLLVTVYPSPVTDTGGSALGFDGLVLLIGAGAARRWRRRVIRFN